MRLAAVAGCSLAVLAVVVSAARRLLYALRLLQSSAPRHPGHRGRQPHRRRQRQDAARALDRGVPARRRAGRPASCRAATARGERRRAPRRWPRTAARSATSRSCFRAAAAARCGSAPTACGSPRAARRAPGRATCSCSTTACSTTACAATSRSRWSTRAASATASCCRRGRCASRVRGCAAWTRWSRTAAAAKGYAMKLEGDLVHRMTDARERRALESFAGQKVHAVAGIGDPNRFFLHLAARRHQGAAASVSRPPPLRAARPRVRRRAAGDDDREGRGKIAQRCAAALVGAAGDAQGSIPRSATGSLGKLDEWRRSKAA